MGKSADKREVWCGCEMRIIRFYHWLKTAWAQSKHKKVVTVEVVIDRSVVPIIDDEIFPDLFPEG